MCRSGIGDLWWVDLESGYTKRAVGYLNKMGNVWVGVEQGVGTERHDVSSTPIGPRKQNQWLVLCVVSGVG